MVIVMDNNYKATYILTLIGIIFGYLGALWGLIIFLVLRVFLKGAVKTITSPITQSWIRFATVTQIISIFGAIVLSSLLIYFLMKIKNTPTQTDLICVLIIGIIGFFVMPLLGALVLIGAILGLVELSKLNLSTKQTETKLKLKTKPKENKKINLKLKSAKPKKSVVKRKKNTTKRK